VKHTETWTDRGRELFAMNIYLTTLGKMNVSWSMMNKR